MADGPQADLWAMSDLETPWAIRVVTTLGVPEVLVDGPMEVGRLAEACRCDADALARVLRHLVARGLFEEPEPSVFALNEAARPLADPVVRIGLDLDGFGGRMAGAWNTLLSAVRTGRTAYDEAFGRPFWEDLEAHPAVAEEFDALMGPGHGTPDSEVLLGDDWDEVRKVVDIGGGTGMLLAEVLRAHPGVSGVLVDLPRTVARAAATFAAAGVAERVRLVGQSFFDQMPSGADLYLMKNVLSDWPDADALLLLTRCAEALGARGRLVVLGGVSPDSEGASTELLMLVLVGGKGRTLSEFAQLAMRAGLVVSASGRVSNGRFAVECKRA